MKDNDNLICVFKGEPFEAEIIKGKLESEGVQSMITNNSMSALFSTYSIVSGPVSVLVNPEDESVARKIIDDKDEDA
jgi:hypothetical protein